ncbi:unnamed protein product [Symbiodinium necroappetens]|uniref:Uncharacterized protein n=1 Tax=Symbiodinium necroappetens TaxID=1628268 RepID=A0A813BFP2_9DINO|nr:unnamed protein product [Symbiodinium necroappetens]
MGRGKNRADGRPWRQQGTQGRQANQGGGQPGENGQSRSWAFWSGTWKSSPRQSSKSEKVSFPAYDAGWKQSAELMEVSSSATSAGGTARGGIVQDVQAAINQARKVEQRLHQLQQESLKKGNAWDTWVREMRSTYARELERHRAEQKRLATDIRELEEMTHAAYVNVQQAAMHQKAVERIEPPPLEWEEAMEIDDDLTEEQTRNWGSSPFSDSGSRMAGTERDALAVSDAYPTPPGLADAVVRAHAANALDPRAMPNAPSQGQSALAAKLSDKRRACRQAMAPFGLGRLSPDATVEPPAAPSDARPSEPRQGIIHDDPDELVASGLPGDHSPGLGKLE